MLTVLMATYNGAETLPDVLPAFRKLEEPPGGWKLVIVDNGSTDHSPEIIRSFCHQLPITLVYEPIRGQNVARNTGLDYIIGDLVVFTDDDTIPQSNWLIQMRAAADLRSDFTLFGGPVLPRWRIPPQKWILGLKWPYLDVTFGIVGTELQEGPIEPDYVTSPNMAVRADVFKSGHRFDTAFGPNGTKDYPQGSETEFNIRLARCGHKSWHCKGAVVYQIVRPDHMDKEWALERAFRLGRGKYRIWAKHTLATPARYRMTKYLIRQAVIRTEILIQTLRVSIAERCADPGTVFEARWWLNYYTGKAFESHLLKGDSRYG